MGLRFLAITVALAVVVARRWFRLFLNLRLLFRRPIIVAFLTERRRLAEGTERKYRRHQNHRENSFQFLHNLVAASLLLSRLREKRRVALP